jgi:hypothetical protein
MATKAGRTGLKDDGADCEHHLADRNACGPALPCDPQLDCLRLLLPCPRHVLGKPMGHVMQLGPHLRTLLLSGLVLAGTTRPLLGQAGRFMRRELEHRVPRPQWNAMPSPAWKTFASPPSKLPRK